MTKEIKDTLKRQSEASTLLKVMKSEYKRLEDNDESLVISVAAPWGYGKTTFLKLLEQEAKTEHFVFYFDAWANDYSKDALTSFLAELSESITAFANKDKSTLSQNSGKLQKSVFASTKSLAKVIGPLLVGNVAKRAVGASIEEIQEAFNEEQDNDSDETNSADSRKPSTNDAESIANKTAIKLANDALETHSRSKAAGEVLRGELTKLAKEINDLEGYSTPIFILIDELDRCRPSFAIELLETMKHFFNTNGVVFVIANNAIELGHSIKVLYGSEFNSTGYLNRFFDFQYRLKDPDTRLYCEGIAEEFGFKEKIFYTPLTDQHRRLTQKNDGISNDLAAWHLQLIMQEFNLELRDVKQIAARYNAISIIEESTLDLFLLLFMLAADHTNRGSHRSLFDSEVGWGRLEPRNSGNVEFTDAVYNRSPIRIEKTNIARIFKFYANAESFIEKNPSYEHDGDTATTGIQKCVLDIISNRPYQLSDFKTEYTSLVEQLSNLTA